MRPVPATNMNWREARLRDLVFFQRGFDITKDQQQDGEVPVISSSGVQSYHSEAKVAGPGVIIGRKGSLGTVHYSDGPYWPHDTTLWSKDLHGNDPRFVYYFVKTLNLKRFDVGNSNPTLNRNHIHDMKVIIPPLPVQERIALIISTYDNLIEVNRRRIYLLEQAARQLYREWFVRLRFPGHERVKIIDGVPEGWERLTALDVMEVLSGGTPKTDVSEFWDGGIPFFTPKDVTNGVYVHDT
jgi:type I restriction enzyme S subunit